MRLYAYILRPMLLYTSLIPVQLEGKVIKEVNYPVIWYFETRIKVKNIIKERKDLILYYLKIILKRRTNDNLSFS